MCDLLNDSAVKIAVRQRPSNVQGVINYLSPNMIIVDDRPFAFDYVLEPAVSQGQLFDRLIMPLVTKAKQGFNCTALAYGQTGTGKTYTMGLNSSTFNDHAGVIPRCLREMLASDENADATTTQPEVHASFIEIYNEKAYDLLAENSTEPISARGFKFTGGTRKKFSSIEECENILIYGNKNRHVRPTILNPQSSRSHAIFTIHLHCKHRSTNSTLNIVDLAGSEGVRRTGHQGMAMNEGVHINQGLLSIGKVLHALSIGQKVVPYRDSVLTSVLQDSLNPNSYLTLLACISSHSENLSQTLSTLRFAQSAKQLKHTPQINTAPIERNNKSVLNIRKQTPASNKRSYWQVSTMQKSQTKIPLGHRNNTFCTPKKVRNAAAKKFNQTEIGLMDKKISKLAAVDPALTTTFNNILPHDLSKYRESLFDRTIESRASVISMNVSTSTVVDAPPAKNTSLSPLVRKCLAEFEPFMERKLQQMMEMLRSGLNEKNQCTNSEAATSPQLINTSLQHEHIRNEISTFLQESVAENSEQPEPSVRPANQYVKCQLFTTSSPVFKVPAVPCSTAYKNSLAINTSDDLICNFSEVEENFDTFKGELPNFAEQTMRKKNCRRSTRLLERIQNNTVENQSNENQNQTKIRNRIRHSVSVLNSSRERRRSTRIFLQSTLDGKENKNARVSEVSKTNSKQVKVSSVVIAGYFECNGINDKQPSSSEKKCNYEKHRKAVLNLFNTGTMKELQLLPQIGQKTAYQIVVHRTLNGKFKRFNQIEKLPIWRGSAWERFAKANMLK